MEKTEDIENWVDLCLVTPKSGIHKFLEYLCELSGAKYAHLRVLSRSKKFYVLVDSIGPYINIGWKKRFHLIDERPKEELFYNFLFHRQLNDCANILQKNLNKPDFMDYLNSLQCGLWIPLSINGSDLGYVVLSWVNQPDIQIVETIRKYMSSIDTKKYLIYSAARSVITDLNLESLWNAARIIVTSQDMTDNYENLANACLQIWGSAATVYIGKIIDDSVIEIITIKGKRALEANKNESKHVLPIDYGLFGFALKNQSPVISDCLGSDRRFKYHSLMDNGACRGSAICAKIFGELGKFPIGVISVEHELDNFFDEDDVRCITGLVHLGYQAITSYEENANRISRQMDILQTTIAHDFAEPLSALIAEANVLKFQASSVIESSNDLEKDDLSREIARRADSIMDTALGLNKIVRKNLEESEEGATTRVIDTRINLFRFLNTVADVYVDKANNQGIEFRRHFGDLRKTQVECDETEFRSALDHLIGNAIKYSFFGRRYIHQNSVVYKRFVRIKGRVNDKYAIIEIENYGIGILKSEFELVKNKFYRGKLALDEGRAGTGRGLWTANQFFKRYKGYLKVRSIPVGDENYGNGSPFRTTVEVGIPYIYSEEQ